jgi:hypothetical protein
MLICVQKYWHYSVFWVLMVCRSSVSWLIIRQHAGKQYIKKEKQDQPQEKAKPKKNSEGTSLHAQKARSHQQHQQASE